MTTSWKPDLCVYHSHCPDGFAAAWAVHRKWGDAVEYVPASYGKPLPCDVSGKHVLMVDFSLKREAMIEASRLAKSIVVLDHHKTAEAELTEWVEGSPDGDSIDVVTDYVSDAQALGHSAIYGFFDMSKSGCRLAWEFCFPDKPMPRLLEHIEDRDLWRFKLEHTRQISAALRAEKLSFSLFDFFSAHEDLVDARLETFMLGGAAILRAHDKNVSDFCEQAYMAQVGGHTVPVVNVPYRYASDVGHALLARYPEAPFAATYWRLKEGKVGWSLRSDDARADVGALARAMGGGGHRNASGFTVSAERPLLRVEPDGKVVEVGEP